MIVAILNPKAGRGKAANAWTAVRAFLPGDVDTLETRGPGHAIELARQAIKSGARTVVAVGGDGTINEVVNAFFEDERPLSSEVKFGIVPSGSGSDFSRILNLPIEEKAAAALLHHGENRLVDVMKVRYTRMDGSSALRYSINITSFGMGGEVAARASGSSYIAAAVKTAWNFPGNSVRLKIDESAAIDAKIANVAVGNGQFHGAGMWVCPGASISDGIMDVTVISHLTLMELVKSLPSLYNGSILSHAKVRAYRARRVEASSPETVLIEIDGEPLGRLPIEISIVPNAIRLLVP